MDEKLVTALNSDAEEEALDRSKWCILVPNREGPPNVVGPFESADEATKWAAWYPGADWCSMISPEFELAYRRQQEEDAALARPRH